MSIPQVLFEKKDLTRRVKELEQQLADAKAELEAERQRRWDGNRISSEENAELNKQIVMLRTAAERLVIERTAGLASLTAWEQMKAALAATKPTTTGWLSSAEVAAIFEREVK